MVTNTEAKASVLPSINICEAAQTYFFKEYEVFTVPPFVLSSEAFDQLDPSLIDRISHITGLNKPSNQKLSMFQHSRFNTQVSTSSKGATNAVNSEKYAPGLYKISGFKPMLEETRLFLDHCWYKDCVWASNITGYDYNCREQSTHVN